MSAPHILIMAGGTGGHVFPALAVAHELTARGASVSWLGTRRGLEAQVVPAAGFAIDYITIAGLRRRGAVGWVLAPFSVGRALSQVLRILRRRRPAAVLGMGGFVTGPGGLGAWLLRRPLLLHEQNAIAGLTNRWLSRFAVRVMEAFPGTFPSSAKVQTVGNPVRAEILALPAPAERGAGREGPLRLFVVGGSLGAQVLNETVPAALARLPAAQRPEVRHQSGRGKLEATRAAYAEAGVTAEMLEFIDDMAAAYAWADLVICRAGALTVSELAAAGMAAILVPFPYAVDDHQSRNARYLSEAQAGWLLPQSELSAETLAAALAPLCTDADAGRARLVAMGEAARRLARPEAAVTVAEQCLREARA